LEVRSKGRVWPLRVSDLSLVSSAASISARLAPGFRLRSTATAPETMAVAGEVPAPGAQHSKPWLADGQGVGMLYRASMSPPMANSFTCELKLV
jgi:hypothetical protein